ncbi:MAG: glucose/arabinose dehydrogenase [Candidatus Azotimanducaceae bacterium]|jgi:glucose/arabinose dehydrogenase
MWWKTLLGLVAVVIIAFMIMLSRVDATFGIVFHSLFGGDKETPEESALQSRLKLPEGFSLGLYAGNIPNARFIEFSNAGDLIVAQPRYSKITLIKRDADQDGHADGEVTLIENLTRPHSIAFQDDYLYIAESNAVGRVEFDHDAGEITGDYERIITGLGDEGNHWSKTIRFGPDKMLYLSSGSTCNVCIEEDMQRATIFRYAADGTGGELVAGGLRNSVGFDWNNQGELLATDNGRDLLGDDFPPCELNKIEQGKFYGWPQVNGSGDLDPDFGDEAVAAKSTSPVHEFRAHNAPLGIRFVNSDAFPEEYKGAGLVALHGSWNRSTYDGYKVVSLNDNGQGGFDERDFVSGFELDGDIIGRPVDIAQGPDDCVYVSDDFGSAIYRVCFGEDQTAASPLTANMASAPGFTNTGLEDIAPEQLAILSVQGEKLFNTRGCIGCHVAGKKNARFGLRPLGGLTEKYDRQSLALFFKSPTPPMPSVRLNSEDELALIVFLMSLE